jgi:hypothetical protein
MSEPDAGLPEGHEPFAAVEQVKRVALIWAESGALAPHALPTLSDVLFPNAVTDTSLPPLSDDPDHVPLAEYIRGLLTEGRDGHPDPGGSRYITAMLRLFRGVAGKRLSELYLGETGADANAIADAIMAADSSSADEAPLALSHAWDWLFGRVDRAAAEVVEAPFFQNIALVARDAAVAGELAERARRLEAEERATAAEKLAEESEKKLSMLPATLRDRVIMPMGFVQSGYQRGLFTKLQGQIQQGELFETEGALAFLRESAEVIADTAQLGRLSPSEFRAFVAVFRLFTSTGDEGGAFKQGSIQVPAALIYQAAGLTSRSGHAYADIFGAMDRLSARKIRAALKVRLPEKGEDGKDRYAIIGEQCTVFEMKPMWTSERRGFTDSKATEIGQRWAAHQPGSEWDHELPDTYVLTLSPIMRKVWTSLVLGGDILQRLDDGAKKVRGPRESFTSLDSRLLMEITLRLQRKDGRSYVDRDALLIDFYGEEKIKESRARGKYSSRYVSQFLKAARLLEEGGIVRSWEQGYRTTRGEIRDVFVPNPDVIKGFNSVDGDATEAEPSLLGLAAATPAGNGPTASGKGIAKRTAKRAPIAGAKPISKRPRKS